MTSFVFRRGKLQFAQGAIPWPSSDFEIGILLLDAAGSYVPDEVTVQALADLPPDAELDTDGYARQTLTGREIDLNSDGSVSLTADDVIFPALGPDSEGPTVAGAILFFSSSDNPDGEPIAFLGDVAGTVNGTDFTISFPGPVLKLRSPV